MKRFIFALLMLYSSDAFAGRWDYIGHGIYAADTNYYHAYKVCGCWYYTKLGAIATYPAPGTPDFYSKFAKWEFDAEEYQREADLIRSRFPGKLPLGANLETTGYQVLQQGYVQGGTTLQSTGAYFAPIDVNGIIHEAQRLQELAGVNSSQANAQVNTIVNGAVEGNTAAAKILAAGQVAAAAIAASQPPTQTTTVFRSTQASGNTLSSGLAQGSADPVTLLSHGLLNQYCSKCHNNQKLSGGIDLTLDPAALAPLRDKIEDAIRTQKMPKNGSPLAEAVQNGMLAGIPRQGQPQQPQAELPLPPAPDGQ